MHRRHAVSVFALLGLFSTGAMAADKSVELLTLEWPPYTASALPENGAATAIVRKAFEAAGYQVKVTFLPWKRAVDDVASADGQSVAFFPAYHCNQKPGLLASAVMGDGPIGFAQNAEAPLVWSSLDDLKGKRIGTVSGYSNTPEFDARAADGRIRAEPVVDDLTNLRKVAAKRLDGAVIDKFVFEYMRKTEASLADGRDKLEFNATPLQSNPLVVCAKDDAAGKALIADFNTGLKTLDPAKLTKAYFDSAL